ncbi:MAG: M24 family metallopeptidase [Candidatus Limnocylindrales bacterium]
MDQGDAMAGVRTDGDVPTFLPSRAEIDRRMGALRTLMQANGWAALLVAGRAGATDAGFVRYTSGWRLWGGSSFVVLRADGDPTILLGSNSQVHWANQFSWVRDARYAEDLAGAAVDLVAGLEQGTVGAVGLGRSANSHDAELIRSRLGPGLADATSAVTSLMVRKSIEERALQAQGARAIAAAHARFAAELRPGRSEFEVVAAAVETAVRGGCTDGIAHLSTGSLPYIHPPTTRTFAADDVVKFSMEYAGPAGYWIELSGVYSFRQPTREEQRLFDVTRAAMDAVGSGLRTGARASAVAAISERVFADAGLAMTGRAIWDAHGIGLNVIEPPLAVAGDDSTYEEGMVINVHPGILVNGDHGIYLQDNFEVTDDGGVIQSGRDHVWTVVPG